MHSKPSISWLNLLSYQGFLEHVPHSRVWLRFLAALPYRFPHDLQECQPDTLEFRQEQLTLFPKAPTGWDLGKLFTDSANPGIAVREEGVGVIIVHGVSNLARDVRESQLEQDRNKSSIFKNSKHLRADSACFFATLKGISLDQSVSYFKAYIHYTN